MSEKKYIFLLGYESAIHEKDAALSANYASFAAQFIDNVKKLSQFNLEWLFGFSQSLVNNNQISLNLIAFPCGPLF